MKIAVKSIVHYFSIAAVCLLAAVSAPAQLTVGIMANNISIFGNNVQLDSFNSSDPNHSLWQTNLSFQGQNYGIWSNSLSYDTNSLPSRTANFHLATGTNVINVGNASIYGYIDTTSGGTATIGSAGSVGDLNWVHNFSSGIQSGHFLTDVSQSFSSVPFPTNFVNTVQTNRWLSPVTGSVASTNIIRIGSVYSNGILVKPGIPYTNINNAGWVLPNGDGTFSTYTYVITNRPVASTNFFPAYSNVAAFYAMDSAGSSLYVDAPNTILYLTNGINAPLLAVSTNADLTIFSGGDITVGTTYNRLARALTIDDIPGRPITVFFSGNASLTAKLYIPGSTVNINGGGLNTINMIGQIVCNAITMNGHFNFHYDESLGLSLPIPPSILVQPTNQTVIVGSNATFSVTATGTTPLQYQWFRANTNQVASAINASFTVTNAQSTNAGNYYVIVANAYGTVTSSIVTLTVGSPPVITNQPVNQIVNFGTNVTFSVTAGGSSPLHYQWNFAGSDIDSATNSTLTVTNVSYPQAGDYFVVVTNQFGSVTSTPVFLALWLGVGQPSFALSATNFATNNPVTLAVTDVNGDGALDIICGTAGNPGFSGLLVYTNYNGGHYKRCQTLPLNWPGSIAVMDVDGDGSMDLITANWNGGTGNSLSVLTNNGQGIFGLFTNYIVGNAPHSVIVMDVNNDGKLDVIAANYYGNSLLIMTNNGSGTFYSNATLNVSLPWAIITSDINGDGKLDLVAANHSIDQLMIFTNNGCGGFGSNTVINVGDYPWVPIASDINGDGRPDLICAKDASYSLVVYTNSVNGISQAGTTYYVGGNLACYLVTDINGDGKPDLICSSVNYSIHPLLVFTNDWNGRFNLVLTSNVPSTISFMAAGDFDGDGKMDFAYVTTANTISVLLNNAIFPPATSTPSVSVQTQGNGVSVSWPSDTAGWSLQQSVDVLTPRWTMAGYRGYDILDDGTNKSLIVQPPSQKIFFRLLHP